MKTLLINAHPDYQNPAHYSLKLKTAFEERYHKAFPQEELTSLTLYAQDIPRIKEGQLQSIWAKQATGTALTTEEALVAKTSQDLLQQFKEHQRIVIASPLHNFNIPSALKDYLDNILIARETFRYLDTPQADGKASTGLMTEDYRLLVLYASGSIYTENDFYQDLDFAPKYLKAMFQGVMGFDQVAIVRAEGTATLPEEAIMTKATQQLAERFEAFYR